MKRVRNGKYTRKVSPLTRMRKGVAGRWRWFRGLSRKKQAIILATPFLVFLIVVPIATYAYYANDISDRERLMNRNNTGVAFVDRDGETFYSIGRSGQRDLIPLDSIDEDVVNALIAAEDKDFYEHGGFSILSIGRALFTNLSSGDLTAYGGSTLTQQLAKNTLLSENKSFMRKYQELAVSIAIEQQYTKNEILEMYLNSVYYGENSFGIEAAADTYFGKKPSQLTLAESAMLIGVLPAPSAYSPVSGNAEFARERQVEVLTRMKANGFITEEQEQAALKSKLKYSDAESTAVIAPHFVEMVIEELSEKYGYEQVMRSGYQVTTTLDQDLQKSLEANVQANMEFIKANNGSNASAVAIDPKTGQVLALVGSANYSNKTWGKVNMVTTARQPGSTFKSIYYAGALAEGVITPATVLTDKPINIGGWQPQNADRTFRGDVTTRRAISTSLNIPSIEVMGKYGIDKSLDQAKALGITALDDKRDYGLPLAIGSGEVPLLQMTSAYATFANKGLRNDTSMITSVTDKYDNDIFTQSKSEAQRGISEAGAYLISDILSDNNARASIFGDSLTVPGHTAAVKTGTTDENRDALTIGYTPSLAIGVWVGNNNNEIMYNGGSGMAGPIWRGTMTQALQDQPDEAFIRPASVVERNTCYSNYGLATNDIPDGTFREVYLSTALPSQKCTPEEPKIEVCEKDTGEIIEIDEDDFNPTIHQKNTKKCDPPEEEVETVKVCELETGNVIDIDIEDFDEAIHSYDTENCIQPDDGTGPPPDDGEPVTIDNRAARLAILQ